MGRGRDGDKRVENRKWRGGVTWKGEERKER